MRLSTLVLPVLLLACRPAEEPVDTGDPIPEPAWGEGERTLSGNAYFFTMESFGDIQRVEDVAGAEVYVYEAPEIRATLDPSNEHAFTLTGIPEGAAVTLALEHDDYFPHLTATHIVGSEDIDGLNFQAVSNNILTLSAGLFGVDTEDTSKCHMATTVTAIDENQHLWWAVGEPGATVTIDPAVPEDKGPIYFNTSVLPDVTLTETSTDGGIGVFGVEPGTYHWTAHKAGFTFNDLTMKCVGGWVTNGVPPRGMQAEAAR